MELLMLYVWLKLDTIDTLLSVIVAMLLFALIGLIMARSFTYESLDKEITDNMAPHMKSTILSERRVAHEYLRAVHRFVRKAQSQPGLDSPDLQEIIARVRAEMEKGE